MKPAMRRAQAGFTLIEMMTVIVILAILATLSVLYLKPRTVPMDVAQRFGDLVREARRQAITYGPVRANVVAANGNSKARTCITAAGALEGSPTFWLNRLIENPSLTSNTFTWNETQVMTVPATVKGMTYANAVGTNPGVTVSSADWASFSLCCFPDGTCQPRSLFFENTKTTPPREFRARISILPLGATTLTRPDWTSP